MYPDEELPQAVGSDILLLLLNIFKILPGVKYCSNYLELDITALEQQHQLITFIFI